MHTHTHTHTHTDTKDQKKNHPKLSHSVMSDSLQPHGLYFSYSESCSIGGTLGSDILSKDHRQPMLTLKTSCKCPIGTIV